MNTNFFNSLTNFLKKRTFEFIGLILISTSIGLAIAFTTYSPEDPSFVYGDREFEIKNFFGIYGSSIADFLLQSFGLVSFLILANFLFWGINLIIQKEIKRIILKLFLVVSYLVLGTIFIYITFNNSFWLIDNGNSGFVGKIGYEFLEWSNLISIKDKVSFLGINIPQLYNDQLIHSIIKIVKKFSELENIFNNFSNVHYYASGDLFLIIKQFTEQASKILNEKKKVRTDEN